MWFLCIFSFWTSKCPWRPPEASIGDLRERLGPGGARTSAVEQKSRRKLFGIDGVWGTSPGPRTVEE